MAKPITPCLWFDGNAREAAEFYTSVFPNSKMGEVGIAPDGGTPSNEPGAEMVVEFSLNGQDFTGLNGGPMFTSARRSRSRSSARTRPRSTTTGTPSMAGGEAQHCGWLKDKFGLSWQVIPTPVLELIKGPKGQQAFEAINKAEKIVIADVQAACA